MMTGNSRSEKETSGSWLTRVLRRLGGSAKRTRGVRNGDRFAKVTELFDGTQTTWRVWGTLDFVDMPHVKLIQEEPPHRIVTVSLSTLLDKRFYHRLAPAAETRKVVAEPASTPETRGSTAEGRPAPGASGIGEAVRRPEPPEAVKAVEDVIPFLGGEGRTGTPKTNPFSKTRGDKRLSDGKATGAPH